MALRVTRGGVNTFAGSGGGRRLIGGPIEAGGGGGGVLNRGTLPPGLITDDALNGAALSTKHIRFHRQGFAYDAGPYDAGAHDNTGWSLIGGSAGNLKLRLGSSEDAFVAYVWGSVGWENNAASAYTGSVTLVLYQGTDSDADGISDTFTAYQRSLAQVNNALLTDGRQRGFSPFAQFVVPVVDGVDWWVGMQNQVASATNPTSGTQRFHDQTLMAFTCAYDSELDGGLVTATLE